MGEEFLLDIIAVLNEQATKKKIKDGLKGMDNSMYVKVISKLSITLSQRQLKNDLKQLNDLYLQVGADLKIDSALKKKLQGRIKILQDSISDLQIGVHAKDSDIAKSVTKARNKGQREASRSSIDFNIEVKKEKAIADLEYMAEKYSKLFSNASASSKYNNILDAAYGITDAKQLSNVRAQIAAFTSELKVNDLASQSLSDKLKRLVDRAKDLFSAASVVSLIFSQVRQAVSSFLQLDTVMTNLYKVQDQITSRDQFSGLLTKWNKLAQNLAVTTNSLISSMEAWSKIGFDLDMSEQLAEITSIFEKTAEISNEKATSTLISAAQAFTEIDDLGVDDYVKRVEAVGDKINAIGNKYAIDSEGIADGLQNASAVLRVAGNDLDETIALITATNKIYQNPEEGSNMLKVASMRLRGQVDALKEMGEDAEGASTDLTKIQQQVYELTGNKVNIFEDDENLKSTYQMILEIGEVFHSLNDRQQADLLEVMFGKQRASAGASLLLNYEELEKIKNDSINSDNSMAEEYSKYMESAEAHITIFKEKLIGTYSTFMSGDVIKYTADMGSGLLDLVNATDLLRHSLVGIVSLNIGKGITSIGASIASTVKQFNMLGSALQQVKNLPVDSSRVDILEQVGNATKSLTEKNLKLLLSQKRLEETDRITILSAHKLSEEEAKLKLEKMGLLSITKSQTTANVAEATTTGTLKNAMLSLKTTASDVGATIKGMFASNPIGMGLMLATTAISMFSTAISKHNEKLEEARQINIESATTASENTNKLKDLYNEYTRLSAIQDRTTSEEESFKTAVENITVALGNKAKALENLIAGTDEYADALARGAKEELQSQAVTATIGRKSAEEELQNKIWSDWSGSQVSIDSNSKGKALSDEAQKAVGIVSESLKEFETINRTWKNISWDITSNDPTEALEYYNSLIEAREKLVLASENDESLLDTEIYEDLNTAINGMSESLDTYIEKLYEEEKLNYMAQHGIPNTTEEYKAMETALVDVAGSSVDLQDKFNGLLMSDFSDLATNIETVKDAIGDVTTQTENIKNIDFDQAWADSFTSENEKVKELGNTLLELAEKGRLTVDTFNEADSTGYFKNIDISADEAVSRINKLVDESKQLSSMSSQISKMSEALAAKKSNGFVEADTLSGFDVEVRGLESWDKFQAVLGSATSSYEECQEAANELATEWVNSNDFLVQLTEDTKEYYETQLEAMGVENYKEVIESTLALKEAKEALIDVDLSETTSEEIQNLIDENGYLGETADAIWSLYNAKIAEEATTINTSADCQNLIDLCGDTDKTSRAVELLIELMDLYNMMEGDTYKTNGTVQDFVAQRVDEIKRELEGLANREEPVPKPQTKIRGGSGKKSGGGSGSSEAKHKEAYEKELKELERMHKLGLISDEDYWKARMDLNEKYFGESSGVHEKYLEEYQKNEEDILEGIKKLWEDYYDKRKNNLKDLISYAEKLYDEEIDSLEASIKVLEEKRDAEKKQWQEKIDAIGNEIDALEDA
ncbi:phage tail tape measure protein, partial [Lachnospiraceae bacterium 38-10]